MSTVCSARSGLLPRLLALPECVVAGRLVTPLLSRFVLLDEVAVMRLVPHLLTPKSGQVVLVVVVGGGFLWHSCGLFWRFVCVLAQVV